MLRLRRWVREPRIEITLMVLTPFLAYWPPEHLGGSGVLATVTAGLYISWNGLRLISAATRLQGIFFGDFLIYLIEGMIFLITGLQAPCCMDRGCGRTESDPCSGSGDADVLRASQLQHSVQHVGLDGHLARLSPVRLRTEPIADDALPARDVALYESAPVVPRGPLPAHAAALGDAS